MRSSDNIGKAVIGGIMSVWDGQRRKRLDAGTATVNVNRKGTKWACCAGFRLWHAYPPDARAAFELFLEALSNLQRLAICR
jgi:hypothetical protein